MASAHRYEARAPRKAAVLIVDDEKNLVSSLTYGLKKHGYVARGALDGASALSLSEVLQPDVVLLDLRLPDMSGLAVLRRLKARQPELPVVMISAHGDTRTAAEAVRDGAEDYFTKPFDLDELIHVIDRTVSCSRLSQEVAWRRRGGAPGIAGLIGSSPVIAGLGEQLRRVAESNARTVLLLGESGTGKALAARAIHDCSSRAAGPFIEVNSATLPETLLEAELFGAEKGAYTDAVERRVGLVKLADGGSLFLDEVGELSLALQAKLLHFLDDFRFRPIGGAREHSADVRVIAATNRDIARDSREGRFREDLFYRLNVMPLIMPRLAERGDDVITIARYFADRIAASEGTRPIALGEDSLAAFRGYQWPGNVRELRNIIERLSILYPGRTIHTAHLPPELHAGNGHAAASLDEQLASTEREILLQALAEAGGHKGRAAAALGISRHALKRRLQRLHID